MIIPHHLVITIQNFTEYRNYQKAHDFEQNDLNSVENGNSIDIEEEANMETMPLTSERSSTSAIKKPSSHLNSNSNGIHDEISLVRSTGDNFSEALKLLIGVGGIYSAFLYYGSLQEDVFRYKAEESGEQFKQAWFLQSLEALANVIVGFIGMHVNGPTKGIPLRMFAISGASQGKVD